MDYRITNFAERDEETHVIEYWRQLACIQSEGCSIREAFSVFEKVMDPISKVVFFKSGWGQEYTPETIVVTEKVRIENRKGRSSADIHPQILIYGQSGAIYSYAVAWSGNWLFELEPLDNGFLIRGGLSDWDFEKRLAHDDIFVTPKVISAVSKSGSLNEIGIQMNRWCEKWIPRNALSDFMPVEWNHWWAYEDKEINEEVFINNVDIASKLGVEVCTLDAGWFGSDEEAEHWFHVRGDWHKVNRIRFPRGIRFLSDYVHNKGMKFGLWCEIEGLGIKAELGQTHPHFVAKYDGEFLGYVCLGGSEAQAWAYETLAGMIERYNCDWIKLDFNLDPGYGCNCKDHGHGPHDGLYEHYQGLYRILEKLRNAYPEVVLENCSSGGQRTDLGMMQHMHLNFLSDPDYSQHQLQAFWAATLTLPPQHCLHWVWSNTCGTEETRPFPSLDLGHPDLSQSELEFHMRVAMLHSMGLSHRLPEYGENTLEKIREQIEFYKLQIRNLIRGAKLYRLTEQTLRGRAGAGWNAYEFVNQNDGSACVFVFCMEHGDRSFHLHLEGLKEQQSYTLVNLDTDIVDNRTGKELMEEGIFISGIKPQESHIFLLYPH